MKTAGLEVLCIQRDFLLAPPAFLIEIQTMVQFDKAALAEICKRHDVSRLRLFGSMARGEGAAQSDIDLIVDFSKPKGFFELIRLEDELKTFFGRPVDLVTEQGLSPFLRPSIIASATVLLDAAA